MANCSECTYLNPDKCYSDGTFWCERKLECVYAYQKECYRYCEAYSRPSSVARSCEEFSRDKSTSSSGCYLTTMLCSILKMPDDNPFLNTLREFRNNVLQKDEKYRALLVEYDVVGPVIANNLNNDPLKYQIAATTFLKYIKPITKLVREKKNEEAVNAYLDMTNGLKTFYDVNTTLDIETINNADINLSGHGVYKVKKITY